MGSRCGKIGITDSDITFPFIWVCLGLRLKPTGSGASETNPQEVPWPPVSWLLAPCSCHQRRILPHRSLIGCASTAESRAAQRCLPELSYPVSSTKPCAKARHHLCWDFNPSSQTEQQFDRWSAPLRGPGVDKGGSIPASAGWKLFPWWFLCCDSPAQYVPSSTTNAVIFLYRFQPRSTAPLQRRGSFPTPQPRDGRMFPRAFRMTVGAGFVCLRDLSVAVGTCSARSPHLLSINYIALCAPLFPAVKRRYPS